MWIFTRYVTWEVLKFFLAALIVLTLLVTIGMGVKEGMARGLPPAVVLRTMPLMVPEMLGITIPVALLYAVCTAFGRMAGTNEIVALKSLGISPMTAAAPVMVLAVFLSLVTVGIYELAATYCRPGVERVVVDSIEDIAYGMLRTNRSFRGERFSITVKRVRDRRLIQPNITIWARGDQPTIAVSAQEAELKADPEQRLLYLFCRNGEVDVEGQMRLSFTDTQRYVIPFEKPKKKIHRDWLSTSEIPQGIRQTRRSLVGLRDRLKRKAAEGNPPTEADLKSLKQLRTKIARLRTEPYRRWSNGFTCFCFVLVGAPVAMMRRSADSLTTFFVCFLPILIVYYPLLMLGEDLSTSGKLPPVAFWLGNAVLLVPGIWLMRRVIRY
jgi:lipopolysaccharide export system permease protein